MVENKRKQVIRRLQETGLTDYEIKNILKSQYGIKLPNKVKKQIFIGD